MVATKPAFKVLEQLMLITIVPNIFDAIDQLDDACHGANALTSWSYPSDALLNMAWNSCVS